MDSKGIKAGLERNGIPFGDELPDKLNIYLTLLTEWNKRMDLTALTDDAEMLDKHFIDSLSVLKSGLIRKEARLIDVGTGAGFPGLVLAMACPDLQVTLLDAQLKRLNFLETVIRASEVWNVSLVHDRAENGAHRTELRERFDHATARALAPMNVLCEYLLPYVLPGGCALCWKGPALSIEMSSGRKAAHILGGRMEPPVHYTVCGRDWQHIIQPVRKLEHTAFQYPRKAGIPKSKPLGL